MMRDSTLSSLRSATAASRRVIPDDPGPRAGPRQLQGAGRSQGWRWGSTACRSQVGSPGLTLWLKVGSSG